MNNPRKRREIQREYFLHCLNDSNIETKLIKEKRICLFLDNYSVHKSNFIKTICKILNIKLIYLPTYSPRLNPIEQVWREIKIELKKFFIKNEEFLEKKLIELFNQSVTKKSLVKNWLEKYIIKF